MARKCFYEYEDGSVIETDGPCEWISGTRLSEKEGRHKRQLYCARELRKLIKPGQTVYTKLDSVSSSGMSRRISVYIVTRGKTRLDDRIRNISSLVAGATGHNLSDKGGIVMGGCGMDMGFSIVYDLGAAMWPKGTRKPHSMRNGEPDLAGGYALRHEWL